MPSYQLPFEAVMYLIHHIFPQPELLPRPPKPTFQAVMYLTFLQLPAQIPHRG